MASELEPNGHPRTRQGARWMTAPQQSRRTILAGLAAGAVIPFRASRATGKVLNGPPAMTSHTFISFRHRSRFWSAGPAHGPLMIFVHGWPGNGLMWRAQVEAFAAQGWHCVAPDMRGYGASSAPAAPQAYAISEIVQDMVELHDHLGGQPAVWVGHDLGSPVVTGLMAQHPQRSRGVALISVPYLPDAFAISSLLPLVDRRLYPADQYLDAQFAYYRFYLTNFDQSVSDFDVDISSTLSSIYRRGTPDLVGKVYKTALITRNGGWFGAAHRAPPVPPDAALWPAADFDAVVRAFRVTGFRPGNSWYLNDEANIAYALSAPDEGRLRQPVLYINGEWDGICEITRTRLGDPMRQKCPNLTVTTLQGVHWLPLERKSETIAAISSWLRLSRLA